ncbi:MAG TPA: translocation/assembly module TamB domain-containing protein [Candidatus Binatia bacterium]|nr:translocation/assembly module TamB domain-containing protein [Candidatus Binatia bacterium]
MRRRLLAAAAAAVGVAAVALTLGLAARSAPVQAWVRARLGALLGAAAGAHVSIGRIGGTLGHSLVLDDVRVSVGGQPVLGVAHAVVTYSLAALLRGRLLLPHVTLRGLHARLVRDARGWRLPRLGTGAGPPLEVRQLRVEGGRVGVALLDASPPRRFVAATITFAGSAAGGGARQALHADALDFTPRGLRLGRVRATGTLAAESDGRLRLAAAADLGPAGTLTAAVRVTTDAPRWALRLAFHDLDPAAAPAGLRPARLDGALRARGGDLRRTPLAYRIALAPSTVAGRRLTRALVVGRGQGHVQHARARLATPAGGAVVRAAAVLGAEPRYRAQAGLDIHDLAALGPLPPGRAAGRVTVHGTGPRLATARAEVAAVLTAAEIHGVTVRSGTLIARIAGPLVEVARARADGPALHVEASGTLDTAGRRGELALAASADLRALGPAAGVPDLAGAATLTVRAHGPLDAVDADAAATVTAPRWRAAAAEAAALDATLTGLGSRSPGGRARITATAVRLAAGPAADVRATLSARRTEGHTGGDLEALMIAPAGTPAWTLGTPVRWSLDEGLDLAPLTLTSGGQRATLGGRIALRGPGDATLSLVGIRLADLCVLAGAPDCAGTLAAEVRLTGTAAAPRLDAQTRIVGVAVHDVRYGDLLARIDYAACALGVHAALEPAGAGELRVEATLPLGLAWAAPACDPRRVSADVDLHAAGLDLAFLRVLAPGTVREAAGTLAAEVHASGTPAAPALRGFAALDGGRIELAATGVPWEAVRIRASIGPGAVTLTDLEARAGEGSVAGGGRLTLAGWRPVGLDLELRARRFLAVRRGDVEAAVSGRVDVAGTPAAPVLRGRLEADRLLLRPAALPGSMPSFEPDPTIEVVGEAAPPPEPPPSPAFAVAEALALGLDLRLGPDAWIRRSDADIQLGGGLHIEKAAYGPLRLRGEIRLVRGAYVFQGRRFALEDGRIAFHGETPPHPTLDVSAVYRAGDYFVRAHVGGEVERPTLTLSSDPPLSQADILAVLLFGRPTQSLGQSENAMLRQHAIQLSSGYAAPELATSVTSALGLQALDVSLPQGTTTPGQVGVGRYVAEDVFLSLAQEFGPRLGQVVGVEYGLAPQLSVKVSTSTRGASAIDLLWHRRY